MQYVAVLITSYNRVQTTLECLKHLSKATLPENLTIEVYLVDDNSPDKTGEIVKLNYPQINVIYGNGNLYWCGGMRLAWETAVSVKNYDFYILLNDDTNIFTNGLDMLFNDYNNLNNSNITPFIVMGACCGINTGIVSYSGKRDLTEIDHIIPSGVPQKCLFICGNLVLIPNKAYLLAGGLSDKLIHRFGDYEYSYRLNRLGGTSWVSSYFCAECLNETLKCYNSNFSFITRLKVLYSPTGLSLNDYIYFIKTCSKIDWTAFVADLLKKHILCLLPTTYNYIKSRITKIR